MRTRALALLALVASTAFAAAAPRRPLGCGGSGCLPISQIAADSVPSKPTYIEVTGENAKLVNNADAGALQAIAYGICYSLGCNYRNLTVSYLTGDLENENDFKYSVVFHTKLGIDTTLYPSALLAALPSLDKTNTESIIYGISQTSLGGFSWATGVYSSTYTMSTAPAYPPQPPYPAPFPPGGTWSYMLSTTLYIEGVPSWSFGMSDSLEKAFSDNYGLPYNLSVNFRTLVPSQYNATIPRGSTGGSGTAVGFLAIFPTNTVLDQYAALLTDFTGSLAFITSLQNYAGTSDLGLVTRVYSAPGATPTTGSEPSPLDPTQCLSQVDVTLYGTKFINPSGYTTAIGDALRLVVDGYSNANTSSPTTLSLSTLWAPYTGVDPDTGALELQFKFYDADCEHAEAARFSVKSNCSSCAGGDCQLVQFLQKHGLPDVTGCAWLAESPPPPSPSPPPPPPSPSPPPPPSPSPPPPPSPSVTLLPNIVHLPVVMSSTFGMFSGTEFTPLVNTSINYIAGKEFSNTFTSFSQYPASTFTYSIASTPVGSSSLSVTAGAPASIVIAVKTATLYHDPLFAAGDDNVLVVKYFVYDAAGRVVVNPVGTPTISVSGVSKTTAWCSQYTEFSAFGTCTATINTSSFSLTSAKSGEVTVSLASLTSNTGSFTLSQVVAHAAPTTVGGYAYLPQHPVYKGDMVSLYLYANLGPTNPSSGAGYLDAVDVTLYYDTQALTGGSTRISAPLFSAATVGSNVTNQLSFTLSASTLGSVSGWVNFATVTFQVSAAGVGTTSLFQVYTGKFASKGHGWASPGAYSLADQRTGWFSTGQVDIGQPTIAGLFAAAPTGTIVDTQPLTGTPVTSSFTTYGFYNTGRVYAHFSDIIVEPTSCAAGGNALTAVASATGCTVTAVSPTSSSAVSVTYAGITAAVASYRVYQAFQVASYATRTTLYPIGASYESTFVTVTANFTLDGTTSVAGPEDVTSLLPFASSNTGVATYTPATRILQGVGPGSTTLSYGPSSLLFTVSTLPGQVTMLRSFVYEVSNTSTSIPTQTSEGAPITTTITPGLELNHEGASANIVTYALGNDGAYMDVSGWPGLTLSSTDPANIVVAKVGGVWTAAVPVGASTLSSGAYVVAQLAEPLSTSACTELNIAGAGSASVSLWAGNNHNMPTTCAPLVVPGAAWMCASPSCSGSGTIGSPSIANEAGWPKYTFLLLDVAGQAVTPTAGAYYSLYPAPAVLGSGDGYLYTNLSSILNVTVTASVTTLTVPGDGSTLLGNPVPTITTLTVTVFYSDGTSQVLTNDARTRYTVASGSVNASAGVYSTANTTSSGSVTIAVSFDPTWSRAVGLNGSITIQVVKMQSLSMSLSHSLPAGGAATSLNQILCSGTYEQGVLASTATLTDSSTRDATSATVFGTSTMAIASVSKNTTLTASADGTALLTASFASFQASLSVPITSTSVSVTAMSLTYPSSTLAAQAGGTMQGSLAMTFSDGTSFTNAITQFPGTLSSLLSFAVDDTARLTVSGSGVLTLVNNSYVNQVVTATAVCAQTPALVKTSTASVAANVLPGLYDAKLGYLTGIPMRATTHGNSLQLDVSFNTGASQLRAWQIEFFYDSSIFGQPTLTSAPSWAGYYTSGDLNPAAQPLGSAQAFALLQGSATATSLTGITTVATISLPVKSAYTAANLEFLTAYITALKTSTSTIYNGALVQITAGTGFVSLNGGTSPAGGRRSLLSSQDLQHRTMLALVGSGGYGDTDGNGVCNAIDTYNVKKAVADGHNGVALPQATTSLGQQYVPTLSYMEANMAYSYTAAQMLATTADISYMALAAGGYFDFLSITSPYDLVPQLPTLIDQTMTLFAPINDKTGNGASCESTVVVFEVSIPVSNIKLSPNAHTAYGDYTEFTAACSVDGNFGVSLVVNELQAGYNVSVKFTSTTSDGTVSMFGWFGGDGFPRAEFEAIYDVMVPPQPPLPPPPPSPSPPPPSPSPPPPPSPSPPPPPSPSPPPPPSPSPPPPPSPSPPPPPSPSPPPPPSPSPPPPPSPSPPPPPSPSPPPPPSPSPPPPPSPSPPPPPSPSPPPPPSPSPPPPPSPSPPPPPSPSPPPPAVTLSIPMDD